MQIKLWSLGKPHDAMMKAPIDMFTKRINNYYKASWEIIPPPKDVAALPITNQKKKEAEIILQKLQKEDYLVLLDERGKMLTSESFADFLMARTNTALKQIIFLIGGAFGVDDAIMQRADYTWSLSALVLPHQLVRLVLAEQLYRACTIIKNEKYHHS